MHLLDRFLAYSAAHPERRWLGIADAGGCVAWTHGAMVGRLGAYARAFDANGVQPGDVVFILAGSTADAVAAFLGAMAVGAVPSFMPPLSPRQDPQRFWAAQAALIERVQPRLILAGGATLAEGSAQLPVTLHDLDTFAAGDAPPPALRSHPIAFLQHTSGTTALKKGVMISHAAALAQLDEYAGRLELNDADTIVSWLPLYHDMGLVACLLLALHGCRPLTLLDPFVWVMGPRRLFELVERERGTLVWLPNFAFNHLARMPAGPALDLSSLRLVVNCSEPCRPESMERFVQAFQAWGVGPGALKTCYAMAETVFAIAQQDPGESVRTLEVDRAAFDDRGAIVEGRGLRLASSGRPLPGVELRIVDEQRRARPDRQVGEILVRAPFLFSGYHRLPQESARKLDAGWYTTGDRGFVVDGEVFVLGRLDDVVVVNGRKVDAAEVEHLLVEVDGLHRGRAVVFGVWNEHNGSHELAVVFEGAGEEAATRRLKKAVREAVHGALAVYPAIVEARDAGWIAKSTSGKISRSSNRRKFLAEVGRV